jgi:hypothetical protein
VEPERTRFDFRDLSWQVRWRDWEFAVGVRELFWGVAESHHVVDVLNQREVVAGAEGHVKLGQPMAHLAWARRWGVVEAFLLTGFRTRPFAGQAGRLWSPFPVDGDAATFASAVGRGHLDAAARWTHTVGAWDIGLAHFRGTSRDPRFVRGADSLGGAVWVPHYDLVDRTSVDLQLTTGRWLWKFEGATQTAPTGRYSAWAGGVEYAFADYLSTVAEYVYDARGDRATTSFQNDLYLGARLFTQDGAILAGAYLDRETGNRFLNVQITRRLAHAFTATMEAWVFAGVSGREPRHAPRRDTTVGVRVSRFL